MKFTLLAISMVILLPITQAAAKKAASPKAAKFRGGNIYELNSEKKKLLFTMSADLKKPAKDISVFSSCYYDPDKNEIMTEEASFQKFALQKYVIRQKQINEVYKLEITEGKMKFTVTKDGKTENKTKDLPKNLVVGPSFVPFLHEHWIDIQGKKKVECELAVLDHMDTFSFVFEKVRDEKMGTNNVVIVRMRPSSTLISSVVRPVYFVVNSDGSRIIELKGRMLPKLKVGTRWEDFEGEAVFMY